MQIHPAKVKDMQPGMYHYKQNTLLKVADEIILKRHVIAINQEVYHRASFGITAVSHAKNQRDAYINLGRKLQRLQMNNINIGLMSSGYSSKSGNDLSTAKRIKSILGESADPSYFFLCGPISNEQVYSRGMMEDAVHARGPAEMIKDDLKRFLPSFMLPNKVIIIDEMPLTLNGKIDTQALQNIHFDFKKRIFIAPRTDIEKDLVKIWKKQLKLKEISVTDDFFELGGTSLIVVSLITMINEQLNASLPLQIIFECPTIEEQAKQIESKQKSRHSRLIKLQNELLTKPIYCWPGLGGYCMNLRLLAKKMCEVKPFYAIQSYGINQHEIPYCNIEQMASEDIKLIKQVQPEGPYTLWGYSFGARVAFEVARQLELSGDALDNVFLIAPGSPRLGKEADINLIRQACFKDRTFLTILFSVFIGSITDTRLQECLNNVYDKESFSAFILKQKKELNADLVDKIISIVSMTYGFNYSLDQIENQIIKAPITLFKASGDEKSFIEYKNRLSIMPNMTLHQLNADHYSVLRNTGIEELVALIKIQMKNNNQLKQKESSANIYFEYEDKAVGIL